jgi:hypothetical protein
MRSLIFPVASLALPLLSLPVLLGCSSSSSACAAEGTVTVTVTNQVDSETPFVCNATVTITKASGGGAQTLTAQGADGSNVNCVYVINVAPGSYTLTATAAGYATGMNNITIQQVSCVTASSMVSIPLIATAGGPPADGGTDDDADVIREAGGD